MKEKGVLLPIFSLPSKYGIGDFGYEAYKFIDILSKNNIKYWEVLPINECNNHPYSPISYYALEEDYISLEKLYKQGLIEEPKTRPNQDRAIYDNFKEQYYKEAFENFKPNNEFENFINGGHQEKNKRAGTENVAEIVGLGKACEIARINLSSHVTYLSRLRNYYFNLLNRYFKDRFRINGSVQNRLPRKC